MSVIWSGITEQGAVVPVQVDETGKVIATASLPDEYVLRSGDTMSGPLVLPGDPQKATEAATKQYVDGALAPNSPIAFGNFIPTAELSGSYNISSVRYQDVGIYQFYFTNLPPSDSFVIVANSSKGNTQVRELSRSVFGFQLVTQATYSPYDYFDTPVSFVVYYSPDLKREPRSE